MEVVSIVDYIHELKEAGFTDKQSEVQARKLEQIIIDVKADIKTEIKSLEVKLMVIYGSGFLIMLGVLAKGFHWF